MWKNWSSWIKGGVIGGIIGVILLVILTFTKNQSSSGIRIIEIPGIEQLVGLFLIYYFITFLIIGALIGWIYGKIKGNKK